MQLVAQLEEAVFGVLCHAFGPDGSEEAFEEGVNCLAMFAAFGSRSGVSQRLWSLVPTMVELIVASLGSPVEEVGSCFEFKEPIGAALQSLIQNDPQGFTSLVFEDGTTPIQVTWHYVTKIMQIETNEIGRMCAPSVLVCMIENLRGQIDAFLPGMLEMAQTQFQEAKTKEYKLFLSQLIAACFYYNAELSIAILE